MADKYIDISCANNGDGTTSSCAAGAGSAGAWNSFTELAGSPTYGSAPTAGDVVNVRTADGSGDLTETMAAAITMTSNTSEPVITVLFDDGTVWATGGGGVFILTNTGGTEYDLSVTGGWHLKSTDGAERFKRFHNSTGRCGNFIQITQGSIIENALIVSVYAGSITGSVFYSTDTNHTNARAIFKDCKFSFTRCVGGWISNTGDGCKLDLINVTFDCAASVAATNYDPILLLKGTGNPTINVYGGSLINETSSVVLYDSSTSGAEAGDFRFYGFDTGVATKGGVLGSLTSDTSGRLWMEGHGGSFNYLFHASAGYIEAGWSGNGNHPTLNATLPDGSSTPWSLLCWNDQTRCSVNNPLTLFLVQKIYNSAAATKTFRVELLIHNSITSPQKDEWYADVWFVKDSDGSQGHVSSSATGALASSTAGWSATTYGGNSYTKYKIEVSSGVDIKQYTPIMINLVSNRPTSATTEFYFVDPDFQLD